MRKMIALKQAESNLLFEKYLKFWTIQAWKNLESKGRNKREVQIFVKR